uniref:Heat shock factor protein 5-like n=2 Tax=Ciona intestinalis TaxID=7719 RepID=F6ZSF5_CIOIN|nr:heat shock factor protein 5-like isoform X1 [Ciona intestinalis]|eukprot:XP_002124437.2 heat shock factor protein 5-like isoform X1 [Ciona intestinalis]
MQYNNMNSGSFVLNGGRYVQELSYTCFPVKLYRIVSNEKYLSLWWAESGSHIVVDLPRFEQEILRNDSVPEADGFKTITFTSFVRQLNLYGFRKVAITNDSHVDPREWQRYAHTYFLRGRPDLLNQIRRQPGPMHRRPTMQQQPYMIDAVVAYEEAIEQSFLDRGLRPSRKGPRPKLQQCPTSAMKLTKRHKRYLQRTQGPPGYNFPYQVIPFNMGGYSTVHAYYASAAPPPYHPQQMQPTINTAGATWNAIPIEMMPSTSHFTPINEAPVRSVIPSEPKQMTIDQWQKELNLVGTQQQFDNTGNEPCTSNAVGLNGDPNLMLSGDPCIRLETGTSEARNLDQQIEQFAYGKGVQNQSSSTAMAASQFTSALNAAVLDSDDVGMTSGETYCMTEDVGNLALWGDDTNLHSSSMLPEHMFVC